ncbi:MAG TPA: EthD family reductase [Caulobacteraceae bacterium]|nr:EthD family reductase [Caulobacteraceae bacterium]
MTDLVVLYKTPKNPEHFEMYYRERHGPMTGKLPGIKGYKYGRVSSLDGAPGEFFWYWSGTFDSRQAALDAMASPAGLAGAADVPNYYHEDPLFVFFEDQ